MQLALIIINNDLITVSSFNSTGFKIAAQNFMESLLLGTDILCLQENFLLDSCDRKYSNTDKIKKKFDIGHDMFIVPAVKDTTQITRGRAKGGPSNNLEEALN